VSAIALENLRKDSELRSQTDAQISVAWILLPISAVLLELTIAVFAILSAISSLQSLSSGTAAAPAVGLGY
jgi:hypothetical protein